MKSTASPPADQLGKLKFLIVLIVPVCFFLWKVRNICIVLVLYGFVGYAQGIRLASSKPARLSNGEPVPQVLDFCSGVVTFLVAACIVYYTIAGLNCLLLRIGVLSESKPSQNGARFERHPK